jgi:hypothetical protein
MSIAYPVLIQEDVAQLQATEKAARDKTSADRVRMLRFLKEGWVAGVSQAAGLWCINRVSAVGWGRYGGSPAAESSDAVQVQRTAPS